MQNTAGPSDHFPSIDCEVTTLGTFFMHVSPQLHSIIWYGQKGSGAVKPGEKKIGDAKVQGAFKKFCNSTIKKNGTVTNYTLFFNIIHTEFNASATFFWQTVNSTKIEIFYLSLQPLLDSFLERFVIRIADRRSESSASWHDNVKTNTLL